MYARDMVRTRVANRGRGTRQEYPDAMRLLLCPLGSHGDVHPYLALGRALKQRGHEAVVCTNPYFEGLVREAGLDFRPLGERFELSKAAQTPGAMSPFLGPIKLMQKLILPEVEGGIAQMESHIAAFKPDACVLHPIALGGPIVCEKMGVPWVGVALAPVCWWNAKDTVAFGPFDPTRPSRWIVRVNMIGGRMVTRYFFDRPLNRIRAKLGMRPAKHQFRTLNTGGVVNLGMWSPEYRPKLEGDPVGGRIVGFPWFDRVGAAEDYWPQIERFLDEGKGAEDAPIVFTMGTAAVHVAGKYFEVAAATAKAMGRRAILLCGKPEYAPTTLPPGVVAFPYAPFSRVFPRGLVNVHHCGIGTTAQGLKAGRPMLCVPMAHDQFDNAARCERLGVALSVQHRKVAVDKMYNALTRIVGDPSFAQNAARIAEAMKGEDGAAKAVEVLEEAEKAGRFGRG